MTQADRQHDTELGRLMQALFDRHFPLPQLPADIDVFALAMELGDRVYARSVQLHGEITRAWPRKACACSMPTSACTCPPPCPSANSR